MAQQDLLYSIQGLSFEDPRLGLTQRLGDWSHLRSVTSTCLVFAFCQLGTQLGCQTQHLYRVSPCGLSTWVAWTSSSMTASSKEPGGHGITFCDWLSEAQQHYSCHYQPAQIQGEGTLILSLTREFGSKSLLWEERVGWWWCFSHFVTYGLPQM